MPILKKYTPSTAETVTAVPTPSHISFMSAEPGALKPIELPHKIARKKLFLVTIVLLPVLSVVLLVGYSMKSSLRNRQQTDILIHELTVAEQIRALISNLQLERSASCIFVATQSQNDNFIELYKRLLKQRAKTDKQIELMRNEREAWPQKEGFRDAVVFESFLNQIRTDVDRQNEQCTVLVDWFHEVIELFVEQIVHEFEHLQEGRLWGEIHAYTAWMLAKEETGKARALGSKLFSSGTLMPEEYAEFFRMQLINDKKSIRPTGLTEIFPKMRRSVLKSAIEGLEGASEMFFRFSGMSFEPVKKMRQDVLRENTELIRNISLMKEEIFLNNATERSASKSILWIKDMTIYSELLSQKEEFISQSILAELETRRTNFTIEFVITTVIGAFCLILCPMFAVYYLIHAHYTNKLAEKAKKLRKEEKKKSHLLFQLLPSSIAQQILDGKPVQPESYSMATVFFSDIVGFTAMASESTAMQVVSCLNQLYVQFDAILDMHDCYKVETFGDSFLVVSGLPKVNDPSHSDEMATISLEILLMISKFEIKHMPGKKMQVRIGLHTGPVAAGVVGSKRPTYCLFGDTVNVASRMESTGCAQQVQLSEQTRSHLQAHHPHFKVKVRGVQHVKGKGHMTTYWLLSKENFPYHVDQHMMAESTPKQWHPKKFRSGSVLDPIMSPPAPEGDLVLSPSEEMPGRLDDDYKLTSDEMEEPRQSEEQAIKSRKPEKRKQNRLAAVKERKGIYMESMEKSLSAEA